MRFINDHKVNPANDTLTIRVCDEPGAGGASHEYAVEHNPDGRDGFVYIINFQNGPVLSDGNGVNGLTHEVLLSIVADRLRSFQKGWSACDAASKGRI